MTCVLQGKEPVSRAAKAAREFGEAEWLSEDELARLCIIIEELVANLYDHGRVSEQDEVELTLTSEPGAIRIRLVDPGTAFDPRSAPRTGERPERGGGAGIAIVRAWVELVDYQVTERGNRLELLLPVGGG